MLGEARVEREERGRKLASGRHCHRVQQERHQDEKCWQVLWRQGAAANKKRGRLIKGSVLKFALDSVTYTRALHLVAYTCKFHLTVAYQAFGPLMFANTLTFVVCFSRMRSEEFLSLRGGLGGGPCFPSFCSSVRECSRVFAWLCHWDWWRRRGEGVVGCRVGGAVPLGFVGKASRGWRCLIGIGGEGVGEGVAWVPRGWWCAMGIGGEDVASRGWRCVMRIGGRFVAGGAPWRLVGKASRGWRRATA